MNDDQIREMFACLDRDGVPGLFPYMTEDVLFRFAGYPEGRGRETLRAVTVLPSTCRNVTYTNLPSVTGVLDA